MLITLIRQDKQRSKFKKDDGEDDEEEDNLEEEKEEENQNPENDEPSMNKPNEVKVSGTQNKREQKRQRKIKEELSTHIAPVSIPMDIGLPKKQRKRKSKDNESSEMSL